MARERRDTDRKRVGRAPTRRELGGIVAGAAAALGIAVNRDGRVFARDTDKYRIQRFDHAYAPPANKERPWIRPPSIA